MSDLLQVKGLGLKTGETILVSDLSFSIGAGKRMGLIGESGSGKSLTSLAITALLPGNIKPTGSVLLDGQEVIGTAETKLNRMRGSDLAVVFQEPLTALDPLMRVGKQIARPVARRLKREGKPSSKDDVQREVLSLLNTVALPHPEDMMKAYPHEISGGQRQRVAIAMAVACRPKLLIADEPTTALDVTTQAEILKLLDSLVAEFNMSLLFISHDLPVVASVVDQVTVLKNGRMVEAGPVDKVFRAPEHDYTKALVDAAHSFDNYLGAAE